MEVEITELIGLVWVLNNGLLNTTFNSSDFKGTYPDSFLPLSGGNITGSLGVSGVIDANSDWKVSGNLGVNTSQIYAPIRQLCSSWVS